MSFYSSKYKYPPFILSSAFLTGFVRKEHYVPLYRVSHLLADLSYKLPRFLN